MTLFVIGTTSNYFIAFKYLKSAVKVHQIKTVKIAELIIVIIFVSVIFLFQAFILSY